MRVFWQYEPNETGKGKFTSRLLPILEGLGVKIEFKDYKKCDVTISYTRFRAESGELPKVLRVDGLHMMRNKSWQGRDDVIAKDSNKADAVIWQSRFCKDILSKTLGIKPKRDFIIFNGDEPALYKDIVPVESPFKRNVVMMAKWYDKRGEPRIQKRVKAHSKVARDYTEIDKDCCFWIIGNNEKNYYESDQIRYIGWKTEAELSSYLKMADVYLYVPWFDWCPNSAVEAMCAGCYLIVSNNGGQTEIADGYGTIVQTDDEIKPKILVGYEPPKPNRKLVIEALRNYFNNKPEAIINPNILIENVALKYKQALESVLK